MQRWRARKPLKLLVAASADLQGIFGTASGAEIHPPHGSPALAWRRIVYVVPAAAPSGKNSKKVTPPLQGPASLVFIRDQKNPYLSLLENRVLSLAGRKFPNYHFLLVGLPRVERGSNPPLARPGPSVCRLLRDS